MLLLPPSAPHSALKLAVMSILLTVAFWLVDLLEGQWVASIVAFSMFALIMLGLLEVAVAMSDPFGDDDVDFDTKAMSKSALVYGLILLMDPRTTRHQEHTLKRGAKSPDSAGDATCSTDEKTKPLRSRTPSPTSSTTTSGKAIRIKSPHKNKKVGIWWTEDEGKALLGA